MLKMGRLIKCSALEGIHISKLAAGQHLHWLWLGWSWSCGCVYRQLFIISTQALRLSWVSWPCSKSEVAVLASCCAWADIFCSSAGCFSWGRALLGQSCHSWGWLACHLPTHRHSREAVQSSPEVSKDRNLICRLSGECHKAAFLKIFRLITSIVLHHCKGWVSPFHPYSHLPHPTVLLPGFGGLPAAVGSS